MQKLLRLALLAALPLTILNGCANLKAGPAIPVAQHVDQPSDCERVLQTVPVVTPRVGDDWRVLFRRALNGELLANATIENGRTCIANQRQLYGAVK